VRLDIKSREKFDTMMKTQWTFLVVAMVTLALTCNAQQENWLPFGRVCNTSDPAQGICSPEHHLQCRTDNSGSATTRCWCPDGMYYDPSSSTVCVVEQNSTCVETPNFGWSTVCTPNAYCELTDSNNGTCLCNQGSIPSGLYCKLTNGYGPCIHDNECARNVHLKCHTGKCSCDADGTDAEWSGTECLGLVGSSCSPVSGSPRNCTNGAECKSEDGGQVCGCQDNNYLEHERRCFLKYGVDCSGLEQCHPLFKCDESDANATTCKCSAEYVDRNEECTLRAEELCGTSSNETLSRDCSQDSSCMEDPNDQPNHRCLCKDGFSSLNDIVCLPTYNMTCDLDWGCNAALHFICENTTDSPTCGCSLNYTWNDLNCIGEYGAENCGADKECVTGFCDADKKCGCPFGTDPYESPGSGTKCGGPEGHACSVDEVCRVDKFFQCLNGSCGCSEDKLSENEQCWIKAERDCLTGSGADCIDGSSCHLNKCTCFQGKVSNEEGRCVEAPPTPPNGSTRVVTFSVSMLVLLLSGTRFLA